MEPRLEKVQSTNRLAEGALWGRCMPQSPTLESCVIQPDGKEPSREQTPPSGRASTWLAQIGHLQPGELRRAS